MIAGLRVADNSVIPYIPSSNTNSVAIMIGEKCADMIKEEYSNIEDNNIPNHVIMVDPGNRKQYKTDFYHRSAYHSSPQLTSAESAQNLHHWFDEYIDWFFYNKRK